MTRRQTGDPYFDWLCIKIGVNPNNPRRNYGEMVRMLHGINYIPVLEMDENRATDGIQLRVDFMDIHGPYGSSTNRGPCTMLEFLIGVAMKMNFLMGEEENHHRTEWYFWRLIRHMGLRKFTDDHWNYDNGELFVEDAVDRVINRKYLPSGEGGLFPLRGYYEDQTKCEIWKQMQYWLSENSDIDLQMNEEDYI